MITPLKYTSISTLNFFSVSTMVTWEKQQYFLCIRYRSSIVFFALLKHLIFEKFIILRLITHQHHRRIEIALVISTHHVERSFQGITFMPRFHHIVISAENLSNCPPQWGVHLEVLEVDFHATHEIKEDSRSRMLRVDGDSRYLYEEGDERTLSSTSSGDTNIWT